MSGTVRIFLYSLYVHGLDCEASAATRRPRWYKWLVRPWLWLSLLVTALFPVGHVLYFQIREGVVILNGERINYLSALEFIRQLSIKTTVAGILVILYCRRRSIQSLIHDLAHLWRLTLAYHLQLGGSGGGGHTKSETTQATITKIRLAVLPRALITALVVPLQSAVLLSVYMVAYSQGKDDIPPVFVPPYLVRHWPLPVRIALTAIDTLTYSVYVYGTRLGLAALVSFVCHMIHTIVRQRVNERLERLISLNRNGPNSGHEWSTKSATQWSRPVEVFAILKDLLRLGNLHSRFLHGFSLVTFLLIAEDFIVSCIDIAITAIGSLEVPTTTPMTPGRRHRTTTPSPETLISSLWRNSLNTRIGYMNKILSLIPLIVIYLSAAQLANTSDRTRELIARYNLTYDIHLLTHRPNHGGRKLLGQDDAGSESTFTVSSAGSSVLHRMSPSLDPNRLDLSSHSDLSLSVGRIFSIRRDFILQFATFVTTFSVMLIQLAPSTP